MITPFGHLSYCTNIHPGEDWATHFAELQHHVPPIKAQLSPERPFGIGLRLANAASVDLLDVRQLDTFRAWLRAKDCYVFTINGFPYGGFHHTVVKADVHTPDWLADARVQYTIRLARILAALLPEGMEGSISTNPLTYRYWHAPEQWPAVREQATDNLLQVVLALADIAHQSGKVIHLDIEPEPDGLMETGMEFIQWFVAVLLPRGTALLQQERGMAAPEAAALLSRHVRLCYDICHFAIGFEDHAAVLAQLKAAGISVGKIQVSAALRSALPADEQEREEVLRAFAQFREPTYLHQVIARRADGSLTRYRDLPDALQDDAARNASEWRAHYHVPLFAPAYGVLQSTQPDIEQVLALHRAQPFSQHLEVETYTWDVLDSSLKLPLNDSIVRELQWVQERLK